jgi:hypothetical protein
MEVQGKIDGYDVWYTVEEVFETDENGNLKESKKYYGAFKFGYPPASVHGETVKDRHGRTELFQSRDSALKAAIKAATDRARGATV